MQHNQESLRRTLAARGDLCVVPGFDDNGIVDAAGWVRQYQSIGDTFVQYIRLERVCMWFLEQTVGRRIGTGYS